MKTALLIVALLTSAESLLAAHNPPSFPISESYSHGSAGHNWPLVVADFTGDGRADVLLTRNYQLPGLVTVMPAAGAGGFGVPITNSFSAIPKVVTVGDFNEDGRLDLLGPVYTGTTDLKKVHLFYGNGAGGFSLGPAVIGSATIVACGDFDQDGHLDFARDAMEKLQVYRGNGGGAFTLSATLAPPAFLLPRDLAVVDVNADGWLDLLYGPVLTTRLNIAGVFGPEVTTSTVGINITVADLNHDPFPDIAMVYQSWSGEPSAVQAGVGRGDGTFTMGEQHWLLRVSGRQYGIAVGDFTGDGNTDLLAGDGYDSAELVRGLGDGRVVPVARYLVGGIYPVAFDSGAQGTSNCVLAEGSSILVWPSESNGLIAPSQFWSNWLSRTMAAGDINGDGRRDIVAGHMIAGLQIEVSVLLGASDGFLPAFSVPVVREARALVLGDLDRDGRDDLVIGSLPDGPAGHNLEILRGSASGHFTPWADTHNGSANAIYDRGIALSDVNGDAWLDIVTSTFGSVSVRLNQRDGTFADAIQSGAGLGTVSSLLVEDFDADGRLDAVAVADYGSADVAGALIMVNLGNGDGTFRFHQSFQADAGSPSAVAGRVDGDGLLDLLLVGGAGTHGGLGGFYYFRNLGGTFGLQYRDTSAPGGDIVAADFNWDGQVEVVTSSAAFGASHLQVRVNDGGGGLTQVMDLPRVSAPYDMLAANFVGGGLADLAVLNSEFNPSTIVIFENLEGSLTPVSSTPASGFLGIPYPNPFNGVTTIEYQLPATGHASLAIYNVLGQRVRTLVDGEVRVHDGNRFTVAWNGRSDSGETVASGIYFLRLETPGLTETRKIAFLK